MKRVAVIGGGASGIMAAIHAADRGHEVILFEKQKKLGRKLSITGNGRCNITNSFLDIEKYHGKNPPLLHNVFSRFGLAETIDFFSNIGIPLIEEKNGRMFPASLQASTVINFLEHELQMKKASVYLHRRIDAIEKKDDVFLLTTAGKERYQSDSVILACGGCAYPQVGGTRIGYELARRFGHSVTEPFPSLIPINAVPKSLHRLQGTKWDCRVEVRVKKTVLSSSTGEILFTGYGISGPAALDVSRSINELIIKGIHPVVTIDFFPQYPIDNLRILLNDLMNIRNRPVSFALRGILKNKMPEVLCDIAGVEPGKMTNVLTEKEKDLLEEVFKGLEIEPGMPRGFDEAVVAAGGVNVDEIDPATMESKIIKNCYITGELLDIDGDSGGYNLQFAWSSGALAGLSQ